jgi:hypothetical protein
MRCGDAGDRGHNGGGGTESHDTLHRYGSGKLTPRWHVHIDLNQPLSNPLSLRFVVPGRSFDGWRGRGR